MKRVFLAFFSFIFTTYALPICSSSVSAKHFLERASANAVKSPFYLIDADLPEWMLLNIRKEFMNFEKFSSNELENFYLQNKEKCLVYFKILKNNLFVQGERRNLIQSQSIIELIYKILNTEGFNISEGHFIINVDDSALEKRFQYPILCFSKHRESNCVCIPDTFSVSENKVNLMKKIEKANKLFPWGKKANTAFWKGAPNGLDRYGDKWRDNPRARIVLFSIDHPDLVFARLDDIRGCSYVCQEMKDLYELLCYGHISPSESCKYKYLIDIDGNGATFHRYQWILRSNCVPIKQEDGDVQWFHSGLQPYIHYVPYKKDCSNLVETISWLRENDDSAEAIAQAGRQFALQYLDMNTTYLYLYHVLKEYNRLNSSISD